MPLTIKIPSKEFYDEVNNEFFYSKEVTLKLEHSLLSIAKWEAKWHKPYLTSEKKTEQEESDYIKCMSLSGEIEDSIIKSLGRKERKMISDYINDPMTATTISKTNKKSREIITNELIYYWMTSLNIPFEPCQKWHINHLLMLIEVASIKNEPAKKMPKSTALKKQAALNAARRAKYNTRG